MPDTALCRAERWRTWLSFALVGAAATTIATVSWRQQYFLGYPVVPLYRDALALVALGALVVVGLAYVLPARVAVGAGLLSFAALVCLFLLCVLERPLTGEFFDSRTHADERFGLRADPNSVALHAKLPDFAVRYTFDADGFRHVDPPARSKGEIVFLGCSFTFGLGVEDDAHFPALLAREWPEHTVVNRAIAGWGTTQSLVVLRDLLAEPTRPVLVLYGYTFLHIQRNYLRAKWHRGLTGIRAQYFEFAGGRLEFRGSHDPAELPLLEESPDLNQKGSRPHCRADLGDAGRVCPAVDSLSPRGAERRVRWPRSRPGARRRHRARGRGTGPAPSERPFPRQRPHPTPAWHRAAVAALARDPRLAFLWGKAK